MKNSQTLTLSKKKYTYNILDAFETEIEIVENMYNLPIEELFTMAARINKKRSFLFVSKVLGKHLPILPNKGLLTAALLAVRYIESVKGLHCEEKEELVSFFSKGGETYNHLPFVPNSIQPIVIGFAETATALGHAFFDCFYTAEFFHTTREEMREEKPNVTFEEEHSHATSHRCYIPNNMINNQREIILVDDEITTGKTALNIIQSIHANYPREEYTVVSILDWRSQENKDRFKQLEDELGIKIHVVSLVAGHVQIKQHKEIISQSSSGNDRKNKVEQSVEFLQLSSLFTPVPFSSKTNGNTTPYILETGRFGLGGYENSFDEKMSDAACYLEQKRTGEKTLCLGTGEFMYLPMQLASKMGSGVYYHSTTRSPIHVENRRGYGAQFGVTFPNPEDLTVTNFVYNIPPDYYDEIFIFFEREVELENLQPLLNELNRIGVQSIKIVFFSKS
ncbi:phosphoribosyltransferase family protein [Neobacillus rhizosphaerae]|uniref:phosphoribosyltransferase family protein n=1 Tax=Neobacillus rhizosphaerae TaxID=2880965 RepID=UPI003D2CF524